MKKKNRVITEEEIKEAMNQCPGRLCSCNKLYYSITYKNYRKAKKLYSRRGKRIHPIPAVALFLQLFNYEWYEYKGRVMIFRPNHKVASFVVKDNKIYNPLIACGGLSYSDITGYWSIFLLIIKSEYIKDIDRLEYLYFQVKYSNKSFDYSIYS